MSYWAIIRPPNHDKVYWAIVETKEEAEKMEKNITKQLIHNAAWSRQIDDMSTREVAEKFGCSLAVARTILMNIVKGKSGDERFKMDTERGEGVIIFDGSNFNYSPLDADGSGYSSGKSVKHYIWFAS